MSSHRRSFDIPVDPGDEFGDFRRRMFPSLTPQRRGGDDLGRRQQEWEAEVQQMREDFFRNTPFETNIFDEPSLKLFNSEKCRDVKLNHVPVACAPTAGSFAVEFEMRGFDPENILVKTSGDSLTVSATQEVMQGGSKYINEFKKSVNLPPHVDSLKLVSKLSSEGVLTVHMPAPPSYQALQNGGPENGHYSSASISSGQDDYDNIGSEDYDNYNHGHGDVNQHRDPPENGHMNRKHYK